jgi:tetratricopeptide (TPR) repeat protein
LRWTCFTALLVVSPFPAIAFNERLEPQPAPLLRPEQNRKVIIFDNDFLDRRFGRSRGSETSVTDSAIPAPNDQSAFTFNGPQIVDVPTRRPAEVLPNGSLLKGIKRGTSARRAAALRLAETGRALLQQGQNRKAIYYLEKALGMDASPSFHFYLARAHFQLADYQSSLRFLQVAESGFYGQPEWLPEVTALKEALSGSPSQQATPNHNVAWTFNE